MYEHVNIYQFQALLTAYDDIVDRNYEKLPDIAPQMIQEQPLVFRYDISLNRTHIHYAYMYYIYQLQALLTAHDDIVDRNYEELPDVAPQMIQEQPPVFSNVNDQIRLVGIMKSDTEPLVNFFFKGNHIIEK